MKSKVGLLLAVVLSFMLISCNYSKESSDSYRISISGSTSVGPLVEKLSENYMEDNKEVDIEINQTGSSAGIKDVINGIAKIGMSSRNLEEEEKEAVKDIVISYDGIAIITNKHNRIENLSLEQVRKIFKGEINNWKEVSGEDKPIVVVSREDGSGTRLAFEEIVGYKSQDLVKNALISDGSGNIKVIVSNNENAIGFISLEYIDNTVKSIDIDGIKATSQNIRNRLYPLSRSFLMVINEQTISKRDQDFINWILSEEGQNLVEESGGIKIS